MGPNDRPLEKTIVQPKLVIFVVKISSSRE